MKFVKKSVSCNPCHAVMFKFSFHCLLVLLSCTSRVTFSSALNSGLQYHTTSADKLRDSGCTKCCNLPFGSATTIQDLNSCSGPNFFVGVKTHANIYEFGSFAAAAESKIKYPYLSWYFTRETSLPLLDDAFLDQQNLEISLRSHNSELSHEWERTVFNCPGVATFRPSSTWNSFRAGVQSHFVSRVEPSQLLSKPSLNHELSLIQTQADVRSTSSSTPSDGTAYVSDFSISLVIGICGLGGCAVVMLIALAFKMRSHKTAMQKLHAKIDLILVEQKVARQARRKDMEERFNKMGEELRLAGKSGEYAAGSPTGVNEYPGSPGYGYDDC